MRTFPVFHASKSMQYIIEYCVTQTAKEVSRMHIHNNVEVIKLTKGSIEINFTKESAKLSEGDIICINSHVQHSLKTLTENTQYYYIQFKKTGILNDEKNIDSPFFNEFIVDTKNPFNILRSNSPINSEITFYMMKMYSKLNDTSQYSNYFMGNFLNIIKAILFENEILTPVIISEADWRKINKIVEFVDSNYYREITLDEISAFVHHSRHYICHLFKTITNQSIFDYLAYVRISAAEILLKTTDFSISQIASAVGFATLVGFDKAFKKINNCTPKQYKKKQIKIY